MREILTSDLTAAHVPTSGAGEEALIRFALTFNAYRRVGGIPVLSRLTDDVMAGIDEGREPPLEDLRAAGFFLARAAEHSGRDRDVVLAQLRHVVGHLRGRLRAGP